MTVAELIAKLQEMPQDARVVTESPEEGWEDVSSVFQEAIKKNTRGGYIGTYESSCDWIDNDNPEEMAVAVSWTRV